MQSSFHNTKRGLMCIIIIKIKHGPQCEQVENRSSLTLMQASFKLVLEIVLHPLVEEWIECQNGFKISLEKATTKRFHLHRCRYCRRRVCSCFWRAGWRLVVGVENFYTRFAQYYCSNTQNKHNLSLGHENFF